MKLCAFVSLLLLGLVLISMSKEIETVTYVLQKESAERSDEFFEGEGTEYGKQNKKIISKAAFQNSSSDKLSEQLKKLGRNYLSKLLKPFSTGERREAFKSLRENPDLEELAIYCLLDLEQAFKKFGNFKPQSGL